MSKQSERRDASTKPGPRTPSKDGQKISSRLDELRALRNPSKPPFSTSLGDRKTPSHLDTIRKPMSQLDKTRDAFNSSVAAPTTPLADAPFLRTAYDRTMAMRQTQIKKLSPEERAIQEEWAKSMLEKLPGQCVLCFGWRREDKIDGYRCVGGNHVITDEMLAEGKGGYYNYLRHPDGILIYPEGTPEAARVLHRYLGKDKEVFAALGF
jgi:hypothetical protein